MPHSPLILSAAYTGGPPFTKAVDVVFDVPMDITSPPDIADWDVFVDGAPIAIATAIWQNPTTCQFVYGAPIDPVATGFIRLLNLDADCKSSIGAVAAFPQTEQFFP